MWAIVGPECGLDGDAIQTILPTYEPVGDRLLGCICDVKRDTGQNFVMSTVACK